MKKSIFLGCILTILFALSGCAKVIELTDEENYLIAEYAAELLLKYDRNTDLKYNTSAVQETSTEEPVTEASTTEVPTTEENLTEEQSSDSQGNEGYIGVTDVNPVAADMDASDFDLAKYADVPNVSIQYAYYMISESYPSHDKDGVFVEIQAPSGYKLLVVKFDIENQTNEPQDVDLFSKDIEYHIIINDSKSAKPMLTILIDDLYTYQYKIDSSMREEAVLLFQISDTMASRIQDAKLKVTYENESMVIQLH
ncbi:MAG: hypothetical protein PUA62_07855 [Lachnospiraceae bacterium]|nr:hypothetical protein [Lachnospiraceae bacterium]